MVNYIQNFSPSPVLHANESFLLAVEMTVQQASVVDVTIDQYILGSGASLEIQTGPCAFNSTHSREFAPNETFTYKWIIRGGRKHVIWSGAGWIPLFNQPGKIS